MRLSQISLICFFAINSLLGNEHTFNTLTPSSLAEHMAFYELYKDTPEGKKALAVIEKLLFENAVVAASFLPVTSQTIASFVALIQSNDVQKLDIADEALLFIEKVSRRFANKKLKGCHVTKLEELLALPPEEIDLSTALFLTQIQDPTPYKIRVYTALVDFMALQIQAKWQKECSLRDKIESINEFIFFEMGFRFPHHSIYSSQIDQFTFLPCVLESRRGVCLGVSLLYLCLAERLGIPLEAVTPPGHIFLRAKDGDSYINIETTMRGVHIHSDEYLGINNCQLEVRTLKEVIGMAHFNQASLKLAHAKWQEAVACYEKALLFMPDDPLTEMWYGCVLFLSGKTKQAIKVLEKSVASPKGVLFSPDPIAFDILQGTCGEEALQAIFLFVDDRYDSIVKKKEALEKACQKWPKCRAALFSLAICWLQIQRPAKAIEVLEQYHALDDKNITVEFYLAELYFSRFCAPQAIKHLEKAYAIALQKNHIPLPLKKLKTALEHMGY
jgi:regulator of sirC expression with transglutaminase-like and TPR domain